MQYVLTQQEWDSLGDTREMIRAQERADLAKKHEAMLEEWRKEMSDLFKHYTHGMHRQIDGPLLDLVKIIRTASDKLKLPA